MVAACRRQFRLQPGKLRMIRALLRKGGGRRRRFLQASQTQQGLDLRGQKLSRTRCRRQSLSQCRERLFVLAQLGKTAG